jgi:transmembrane sensor
LDELIILVLDGSATSSQREEVRRWRAESPENDAYYRSTQRVWQATQPSVRESFPPRVDPAVIVAEAERRRGDREGGAPGGASGGDVIEMEDRRPRTSWQRRATGWSVAAAAAVAALALGVGVGLPGGPEPLATFAAGPQTSRSVNLEDGSFVRLAPGSSLQAWAAEGERRYSVVGRAFFAVAHDDGMPFVVRAGDTETRVLGTRFEVAEQGSAVRTVVVDGRVAVSNDLGVVEVPAGALARVAEGSAPVTERPDDVYALLDWPGGVLLFQGTPLAQVADEVQRHFRRTVDVRGEALRALRISGSFEEETFEEVVLALCDASGAQCGFTEDGATLASND